MNIDLGHLNANALRQHLGSLKDVLNEIYKSENYLIKIIWYNLHGVLSLNLFCSTKNLNQNIRAFLGVVAVMLSSSS